MRKIIILLITLVLCLTSCTFSSKTYTWEFAQDASNVKEIKIIEVYTNEEEYDFTVIKELDIELVDELYSDIKCLKMKKYGPSLSAPGGLCFLIMFENGEYDIVALKESKSYKYNEEYDKIMAAYNSWLLCCNQEEFDALINKYLDSSDNSDG